MSNCMVQSMTEQRFPYAKSFLYSFGFFTNNLTWSVFSIYVPIFLSNNFQLLLGETKIINTLVGVIMVLDNIASVLIQPYIGELSDRTWINKLGRRMPFVIIGIPLAAFFFGLIGSAETTLWLLIVAISGFNISMAFYKTPVMSLFPDMLPEKYRNQGSGVLNVTGGIASVISLLLSSYLYRFNHAFAFWGMSIIMMFCLIILLLSVREKKEVHLEERPERVNFISAFRTLFRGKNWPLILMLFGIFFYNGGYQVIETYMSRYLKDILGFSEDKAAIVLGIFVAFQIVAAIPAGLVGQRIGALNAVLLGLFGFVAALIPAMVISVSSIEIFRQVITLNNFVFSFQTVLYFLLIVVLGFSWLLLAINGIVVIWNMSPMGKTGMYTSYFYLFMHSSAIINPFLAGIFFDSLSYLLGQNGLKFVFIYVLVSCSIALALVSMVKRRRLAVMKKDYELAQLIKQRVKLRDVPLLYLPMMLFGIGVRQDKAYTDLRKEQLSKEKELRQELRKKRKKFRNETTALPFVKSFIIEQKEEIKEQKQKQKDMAKKHLEERRKLREEIIDEKLTQKLAEFMQATSQDSDFIALEDAEDQDECAIILKDYCVLEDKSEEEEKDTEEKDTEEKDTEENDN